MANVGFPSASRGRRVGQERLRPALGGSHRLGVLHKRTSDLLSMWVGGTEKRIADAFAEARDDQAFLVFDEADSLLADRRGAQRNWEVTQVNEMLTWMESHPCRSPGRPISARSSTAPRSGGSCSRWRSAIFSPRRPPWLFGRYSALNPRLGSASWRC